MELFYHNFGKGKNLIIIHGLFGISDNWVSIAKSLSANFNVYIPDLRNHGRSPHSQVFNYDAMTDDLLEFMDSHAISSAILIGHSMGGKLAMNFALEYPQMVEKLVVVDISPRNYPYRQQHLKILEAMESADFNLLISRNDVEEYLKRSIPDTKTRLFILKNLHRLEKGRLGWRLNTEAISNNLELIFEGISGQKVFDKPVLFVKGSLSDYILDDDIPLIKNYFPDANLIAIEGASHWVHSDKPEELCTALSVFLGKSCN